MLPECVLADATGPFCAPALCSTNTDCGTGMYCEEMPLCIVQRACGGLGFDAGPFPDGGSPPPCTFDVALGACASDGTCAMGACETPRVCQPLPRAPSSGCACRASSGGASALAGIAAIGLALVLAQRARR